MTQPSQQAGPKDRPAALMSPMSQLTCDTLTQSATVPNHSGSVTILVFKYEHLIPVHLFEHRFRGWIGRDLRHLPTTTQTRGDRRPSAAASPLDDPARKPRLRGASPPPPPRRRSRTRVTMPCRRLSRSFWTDSASQVNQAFLLLAQFKLPKLPPELSLELGTRRRNLQHQVLSSQFSTKFSRS